jgi:hypothetical protein
MQKLRSLVLSFIIVFAATIAGMKLDGKIFGAALFSVLIFVLLATILLFNVLLQRNEKRKSEKHTEREKLNELLSLHAKAKKNFTGEMRKMILTATVAVIYITALLLLSVGFCFFSGAAFGFTFTVLIGWYFVFCVVDRMCCISFRPVHIDTIAPEEYPAISKIIDEVRDIYDIRDKKLYILPDNSCNAGIAEIPGGYSLYLGVPLGSVTDENELRQIMIHEFAHVKNLDTRIGFVSAMLMTFMEAKSRNPVSVINLMFKYAASKYNTVYSKYRISSAFVSEENADAAILKYGNPQLSIDAMSKINCYGFYVREDRYNLFADYETLPEHICSVNVRHFKDALEKRSEAWKELIKKELPAQLNSHPTFNQRQKNLKVEDFEIKLKPLDNTLKNEWTRLAKFTDERIANQMKEDYGKKRQKIYNRSLERVKDWEESDKTRPPEEMRTVIDSYMNLVRIDEASKLCIQTIDRSDNDNAKAYPLFLAGQNRLREYDLSGIELVKRAMAINANYVIPGMNMIGDFYRTLGKETELEEYRAIAPEEIQKAKDTVGKAGILRHSDRLSPERDISDLQKHIESIVKLGKDNIREIYLVRKTINNDFFTSAFVVKFKARLDKELAAELLFDIFNYFDTYPSKRNYSVFEYNKTTRFAVKKVAKSRIYKAK